ncbi:MAG TPA: NAD-dependent epimerase/dehydratase family protein [Verrucomicrobiales bacterium]|nr:NAD-dependent epimerase/dehydratase family protein [Verrucomicrobiales bacterium]
MRVLLTGGAGFLGSHFLDQLIARNHEPVLILRKETDPWRIAEKIKGIKIIYSDLRNLKEIEELILEFAPEAVVNIAWQGVSGNERNRPEQIQLNWEWNQVLLETAQQSGCRTWIGIGSQAEYGPLNRAITEEAVTEPSTLYGITKLMVCHFSRFFCRTNGMRWVWLRLFSSYGPRDSPDWLIPYLIRNLLKSTHPTLTKGEQLWDFLYIRDAAAAVIQCLECEKANGIYNLGSGKTLPLRSMVEMLHKMINPKLELRFGEIPYRPDQVMHLEADITRLKRDTQWKPETALEQGLRETIEWFRSHDEGSHDR